MVKYPDWWKDIRYFEPHEFDSPDKKHSGALNMNEDFVRKLDDLRHNCGFPFVITSGYRTAVYNKKVGGRPTSMHLFGRAADIHVGGSQAHKVLAVAAEMGLTLGVSQKGDWERRFIHVDDRETPIVWSY